MKIKFINVIVALFVTLFLSGCKDKNHVTTAQSNVKTVIANNKKIEQDIDTSKAGILVMKNNKTIDDQMLMLKNAAFCNCIGTEEYIIQEQDKNNYKPIPDNSIAGYIEYSDINTELFIKNPTLDKIVKEWSKKQYNSKPSEDEKAPKTYLMYMKCLDFYNSNELNNYIDSVKQVELKRK